MPSNENKCSPRKCGEIMISIKKNTKNFYQFKFNCSFCDTICIQLKRFTLHLEQEHSKQLEEDIANDLEDDGGTNNDINIIDNIKVETVLEEECVKSEGSVQDEECEDEKILKRPKREKRLSPAFTDPLENKQPSPQIDEETYEDIFNDNLCKSPELSEVPKSFQELQNIEEENNEDEKYESNDETEDVHNDKADISSVSSEENANDSDFKPDSDDEVLEWKRKKLDNDEIVLGLIEAYKNKPQLWDIEMREQFNAKQKEKLFQDLTKEFNAKCKTSYKCLVIRRKIRKIAKNYETELEEEMKNPKVQNDSKLWYSKEIEYLKESIEYKLNNTGMKRPKFRVKPLSKSNMFELIDIYKSHNSLWDVNHLAYTIRVKRDETMQLMLNEINEKLKLELDMYKLKKHLNYLHKIFSDEKRKRLQSSVDIEKSQHDKIANTSLEYYEKCEFLLNNLGPYKCEICSQLIATYKDYQVHQSQHSGSDKPFKCPDCGMEFRKLSFYQLHAKRHLQVFNFYCKVCGKGYPFGAELDLHMRSHTGETPYLCSLCGDSFRNAMGYDNHIRRHEERFRYSCEICEKGFNNLSLLNYHVKAHLNVRDVICPVCGKGFTTRKNLNTHKRIHEGKNYTCNICGKSFAQDAGLRQHKKYHGTPIGASSIHKEHDKLIKF